MNFLELDKKDGSPRALINPDHIMYIVEDGSFEDKRLVKIFFINGDSITSDGGYEKAKEGWELAMRNR